MKSIFTFIFLMVLTFHCQAQNIAFEPVSPGNEYALNDARFIDVYNSSHAFGDIDSDGDQDIVIMGRFESSSLTVLYLNDGLGNFTWEDNNFNGFSEGSVAFADLDGDNDLDLLFTGIRNDLVYTELYKNNGAGQYNLVDNTPFPGLGNSSIAIADIDGDNDQDIFISGSNEDDVPTSQLYFNDGSGIFTLGISSAISNIQNSSVAFKDVDNDNDQDLFIAGNDGENSISELYLNDGMGNFSISNDSNFTGLENGAVVFSDIDSDDDFDLFISGDNSGEAVTQLYTNDGLGNFSLVTETPFQALSSSSIACADIDDDADQDLIISGNNGSSPSTEIYLNDGEGGFFLDATSNLVQLDQGSIAFSDVDGDDDADLVIVGHDGVELQSKLYINDSGYFREARLSLFSIRDGESAFSDIDNDGDLDLLVTGRTLSYQGFTQLFKNDGEGVFTPVEDNPFSVVTNGNLAFADVDADGDEDVLMIGRLPDYTRVSELYLNDGEGNFSLVLDTPFTGIHSGVVGFADFDGDNDQDVIISGSIDGWSYTFGGLYKNNGDGSFQYVQTTASCANGDLDIADVDGDNDLEFLISGYTDDASNGTFLSNNSGDANFTYTIDQFPNVTNGSHKFADIDGDGDQDAFITGNGIDGSVSKLFKNDGTGQFSPVSFEGITNVSSSAVAFADVDGDNDQDLIITGYGYQLSQITELYLNDGEGNFDWYEDVPFLGVSSGSVTFADIDGDDDQDVLIIGNSSAVLWRNVSTCEPVFIEENSSICSYNEILVNGNNYNAENPIGLEVISNGAGGGCDISINVNLSVYPDLDTNISLEGSTLSAIEGYSYYRWYDCESMTIISGEIDSQFTPLESGSYYVRVGESPCYFNSECIEVTIVGVNENLATSGVSIYPNPTTKLVTINLGQLKDVSIQVFNLKGQILYSKSGINTTTQELELDEAAGIYILEISSEGEIQRFKLVKE